MKWNLFVGSSGAGVIKLPHTFFYKQDAPSEQIEVLWNSTLFIEAAE
ncbi:hypothetical protein [Dyadobacter flavalbus]|nr:hypothetical protein [Dyadobacter flavalbus]